MWITQGSYLDSEYFTYVLLDASQKYKKEIDDDNIDRFYEVMFHSLNLNNLAVNGKLFTPKFKSVWEEPRIMEIRSELQKIYSMPVDVAEIFKNANYMFLSMILEYMKIHIDILSKVKIFHLNKRIQVEPEIFLVINHSGKATYKIWKFAEDKKRDFGYSFTKVKSLEVPNLRENVIRDEIEKLNDPKFASMNGKRNVIFAIIENDEDERKVAKSVKDVILLNRGIAKSDMDFSPEIITELYSLLMIEKLMPFTLNDWIT